MENSLIQRIQEDTLRRKKKSMSGNKRDQGLVIIIIWFIHLFIHHVLDTHFFMSGVILGHEDL